MSNQTAGTTVNYRLALNGATGVTLTAGQTLTVRLYFSCGSGSAGRYGKLKDVFFKGLSSATIPLSIIAFNAEKINEKTNRLAWTTANEINVERFDIERSLDGQNFTKIGTAKAVGNSKNQEKYTFLDENAYEGVNYYRLKTLDFDGTFAFSKVMVVDNRASKNLVISTFPNPVVNELTLEHPNLSGEIVFTISDIQGKKWSHKTSLNTGKTTIDTHVLPSGLYFIECQNKGEKRVLKFVKQ